MPPPPTRTPGRHSSLLGHPGGSRLNAHQLKSHHVVWKTWWDPWTTMGSQYETNSYVPNSSDAALPSLRKIRLILLTKAHPHIWLPFFWCQECCSCKCHGCETTQGRWWICCLQHPCWCSASENALWLLQPPVKEPVKWQTQDMIYAHKTHCSELPIYQKVHLKPDTLPTPSNKLVCASTESQKLQVDTIKGGGTLAPPH